MKKIFNAILSVAAALFVISSCEDENINLGSRLTLSQTEDITITAANAKAFTFNVESDGDWVVVVPSWIKANPRHGTGDDAVTLTFEDNYSYVKADNGDVSWEMNGSRHATVSVECASGAVGFVVRQEGDPSKPSDEIISITIGEFLQKPDGGQIYQVAGTVTSIKNTTYGNLYINDGTGEVYIYGLLDRDGNAKNFGSLGVGVGDFLTVQGSKTTYNGTTIEIINAQYISHEKSLVTLAETTHSVPAEGGSFSVGVDYKGDNISVVSDGDWLAFTGVSTGTDGTVLNFTAQANTGAARSANVTVSSSKDGTTATQTLKVNQAAGGSGGGGGGTDQPKGTGTLADPYNPAGAVAAVANLTWTSNTEYQSTDEVYVKGKISKIADNGTFTGGGTYGNASFYISADGSEASVQFYCFRVLYLENKKYESGQTDIKVGDDVVICGKLMNYKGTTPETVANSAYLYSLNAGGGDNPGGGGGDNPGGGGGSQTNGTGTLADPYTADGAVAAVANLTWTSNTEYQSTEEVYVKGKISKIANNGTFTGGGTYGNASFYISADGTETSTQFYCFRVLYLGNKKYESGQTDINVGDEVIICGKLMNYKGNTPETVANASYVYSLNGVTGN